MTELFVDTSGWASSFDRKQTWHTQARAIIENGLQSGWRLVTTNLILVELTALLASPLHIPKPHQVKFLSDLRSDPDIEVVAVNPQLEAAAWTLWISRVDKDWSLVDCSSYLVMQSRGLSEAVTADHHFEQAGFVRLLK